MVVARDLYALLGVNPHASQEEIKRQYRRLVRQYHPDVNLDKVSAHRKFVEIVDAYKTLSDPARRLAYDAVLREKARTAKERRQRQKAVAYSWEEELRRQSLDGLVTAAELCFLRGQVEQAIFQCKEVLTRDRENPHAYGLLGDIYRSQGQTNDAMLMYTYAAQFAAGLPGGGEVYLRKIDAMNQETRAPRKATVDIEPIYSTGTRPTPLAITGAIAAMAIAVGVTVHFALHPAAPLAEKLPVPANFMWVCAIDGMMLGLTLAWLRLVRHSDAELFGMTVTDPAGTGVGPLGVFLILFGMVFFYAAIVVYLAVAYFEEVISLSIIIVFVSTLGVLAILVLLCPTGRGIAALWGGNVLFTCAVVGWILGSIGRSPW